MHLKVFLKLKNPENSLFYIKKPKKHKKHKKTTSLVFFLKTGFFPTLLPGLHRRPGVREYVRRAAVHRVVEGGLEKVPGGRAEPRAHVQRRVEVQVFCVRAGGEGGGEGGDQDGSE